MSNDLLLVLPLAIPLTAAVATLLLRRVTRAQVAVSLCSMSLLLGTAGLVLYRVIEKGVLVTQIGAWPAPFGISLAVDHLGALMLLLAMFIGLTTLIYAVSDVQELHIRYGFYPLFHLLILGTTGIFLTGDLFNLYVWFEVTLIASFILMALGNRPEQLEGAIKYISINLVGSAFLLAGVGLIYGMTGSLNLAELALRLQEIDAPGRITGVSMLFLTAFGIKAAIFPFYFWLPASYHTPSPTISALFAGLLTKVGVYALLRVFTLIFGEAVGYAHTVLLWLGGLTMLTGVLGALTQQNLRRLLSFHVISTIGFMIIGVALFTPQGLAGSIFYIVDDVAVITNLFLIAGYTERVQGTTNIYEMGGLYLNNPFLSIAFAVSALSLTAFPPISGFWAKFFLTRAGFAASEYVITAVMLLAALLTLFSMARVWLLVFLRSAPNSDQPDPGGEISYLRIVPIGILGLLTLGISLYPAPLYDLSTQTAHYLLYPASYIDAVLAP